MHKRNARLQESEFLEKGTGRLLHETAQEARDSLRMWKNSGTGGKKRREGKKGNPAEILAETPISKGIPGSEKRKENSGGNSQSHTNHCV